MFLIPLTATASQELSFNLDGAYWQLRIYQAVTQMCADVSINGKRTISGTRCFVGQGVLPYTYLHAPNYGNFVFDGIPDWTQFGSAVNLWYMNSVEFQQFELMTLLGTSNIPANVTANFLAQL